MKRYNNLFDKIVSLDNLYEADKRARRQKSHRPEVMLFDKNKDKLLLDLQRKLINGEYETSEYYVFKIYEPKEKEIFKLPYYPDRIVHHAIMNIMEPIWVSAFVKGTYSCIRKRGIHKALKDVKFALDIKQLGKDYCFSSGLATREVLPNGDTRMHNIITEGFVEGTARAMIRAIDPQVMDIDEEKYPEYVEMAKSVIESRDMDFGANGQGQTYADFIMHSIVLKRDLESRTVVLDNGSKVDGLHYLSDYANKVQSGKTRKAQFYRNMPNVARKLNLSKTQIDTIRQSNLWQKRELTEDEQNYLIALLVGGTPNNQSYVDTIVADFAYILKEEAHFYNGIAEKLGYKDRTIVGQKSTQDLGKETLEEQKDTAFLDNIEQAQERQLKELSNQREEQENIQIGD